MAISSCISNFEIIKDLISLYSIPIPLEEIVNDEDIVLICDDYGENTFDGLTVYEPSQNKFYIHINKQRRNTPSNNKGRFTLAHELGHYFIDNHRLGLMSGKMQAHFHCYNPFGKNEEWFVERQADSFAASLLMPDDLVLADLRKQCFSGDYTKYLSQKYQVSFSAMAMRCLNLKYIPLMLVYAEQGIVKWQLHSDDFPFYRLKYGNYKVPENSVLGEYFSSRNFDSCKKDEIVFAGDCFDVRNSEQLDMQFFEYCIPYRDSAFSMFWQR